MANIVYIATSLDGYIADKNGGTNWLHTIPNPNQDDFGFSDFIHRIDALVMGRNTFEAVCGFDCPVRSELIQFILLTPSDFVVS